MSTSPLHHAGVTKKGYDTRTLEDRSVAAWESADITDRERAQHLVARDRAYLNALEAINAAIVSAQSVEALLDRVLETVLDVFDCDRAWLLCPCSPEASSFRVEHEKGRPGWTSELEQELPMTPAAAAHLREVLQRTGAVRRDPECDPIEPGPQAQVRHGARSSLSMALRPRCGEPWLFCVQHCAEARVYEEEEVRWFETIGARVSDGLTSILSQRELRQSEARFRTLFENAPEAIVIYDADADCFVDANANTEKLLGVSREDLLQLGPLAISPEWQPDGRLSADVAKRMIREARKGEHLTFEWLHVRPDGGRVPCEVRLVLLPHPERTWIRVSLIDISARKRDEEERARLNEQLFQAQKMQALGQLTGGVAHDFNNLLTVIVNTLTMVSMQASAPPKVHELVRQAQDAAHRASELTQRLLAFARKQPLRPRSVDLNRLIDEMQGMLRRTLGEAVRIEIRRGEPLWCCEVDPNQLESAVLNLVLNARDAMPHGGRVFLETSNTRLERDDACNVHEARDYVRLRVRDEGLGIAADVRGQVFEPFFTTKEVGKGSGLGLSMVYGFVRQSDGHVRLHSEPGEGTTVEVFLPRSERSADESPRPPSQPGGEPHGNGERVLVVEDDPGVRALSGDLLDALDYRSLLAESGAAALRALTEHPDVRLLLTDVVLAGGMDGPEVAARARALSPELRVLFMSGYAKGLPGQDTQVPADALLLQKPFSRSQLAIALEATLNDAQHRQ